MDQLTLAAREKVSESLSAAWWMLAEVCLAAGNSAPESLIDAFVACEVVRLLDQRDRCAWLSEEPTSYGPAQTSLAAGEAARLLATAAADALGPYALLSDLDERAYMNAESLGFGYDLVTWAGFDAFACSDDIARELGLAAPPDTSDNRTWRYEWTQP